MDQRDGPSPDADTPIDQVIAAYLEAVARGEPADRNDLLDAYPNSADELRQFFADHDRAMQVAGPWRSLSDSGLAATSRDGSVAASGNSVSFPEPTPTASEPAAADGH